MEDIYQKALENNSLGSTLNLALLRDILLPNITGEDSNILYWLGKDLARNFNLKSINEISQLFKDASFGNLEKIKVKSNKYYYTLSGDVIKFRLKTNENANFNLEAGFLAELIQKQIKVLTEALIDSVNKHKNIVTIIVQIDPKDNVSN